MNKIKNQNGFAAFILVVSISALMLAFTFMASIEVGHYYDEVVIKENRMISYYSGKSCVDYAFMTLAHDYFFLTNKEIKIPELNCSIDLVSTGHHLVNINAHGDYKGIKVYQYGIGFILDDRIVVF